MSDGGEFVVWGNLDYVSEFGGDGQLQFNAEFPTGVNTYRVYLLPWGGSRDDWGRARGQR